MELKVKVYNINKGRNPKIESQSEPLRGYAELVAKARTNQDAGMGRDEAIKEAVKQCVKEGILSNFLKEHGSEVENMLLTEWNWDDALQVSKEEGKEDGIEIGVEKGKLEIAMNMKNFKMPLEEIAKYTGLPLEKLAAL
jgi:predicted transposase/invertase (TIGR01784 family)